MSSNSRTQLESWLKTIDVKAARVLDVGGAQLPAKGRTKSWDVKEYRILDLPEPHEGEYKTDIIADINESISFTNGNPGRNSGGSREKDSYDIVFCLEVMEYVWHPQQALLNINTFLKKGGELYISFHFLYPVHGPDEEDTLRYTEHGARRLLQNLGFRIEQVVSRRMTSEGLARYRAFCKSEDMRLSRRYTHDSTGCFIRAKKGERKMIS